MTMYSTAHYTLRRHDKKILRGISLTALGHMVILVILGNDMKQYGFGIVWYGFVVWACRAVGSGYPAFVGAFGK